MPAFLWLQGARRHRARSKLMRESRNGRLWNDRCGTFETCRMHRIMSEFEGQSGKHLLVLSSSQFDQSGRRHLARVLVIPRIYPLGPGRMAACSIWSIRQRGLLRAKGAQMQEEGYALPAAASSRNNGVFRKARLTKCLDQEPGIVTGTGRRWQRVPFFLHL